ncbi:helix-turn-helix domain-containing protein [Mycobacteroides abscessus]|uniref:helix-turn-helix domain-containing protein n=1 Tax=Mycobacteroides abscessus TaxID=36809 RepID=UPI000361E4F5|nr:helix-turn-helix transcriptional regulator [Mycobacteroides abscessus]
MTTWRAWSDELTMRVAKAVKSRRIALGLTASELADRTAVGKPLTRAVISDLETGRKKSLEVSELLTLAAALELPPILLLFPDYPDGTVELVPETERGNPDAVNWFSGSWPGPQPDLEAGAGVLLMRAVRKYHDARISWALARAHNQDGEGPLIADEAMKQLQNEVVIAESRVKQAKANVWAADA